MSKPSAKSLAEIKALENVARAAKRVVQYPMEEDGRLILEADVARLELALNVLGKISREKRKRAAK